MSLDYQLIFKNKNFLKVWISQICSQLALYIMNFILITQIFENTFSTIAVSLLWVFYNLPAILIGPFSGFFVDIWSKKKIMTITNFFQALVISGLFFIEKKFYLIYAGVFAYSFLNQFYVPSEAATIPWLVKKKDLPFANSLFLLTGQASILVGLGGGSILLKIFTKDLIIILCSALLLIATIAVALLPQDQPFIENKYKTSWKNWLQEIKNGWVFLSRKGKLILTAFTIMALTQTGGAAFGSILPAISQEILKTSLKEVGSILVPPLVIGLIGGSFLFSKFPRKRRKKQWISLGITIASCSLIVTAGLHFGKLDLKLQSIALSILLFILGIAGSLITIPCQTFVQEFTPPKVRGRVFSLLGVITSLAAIPPILTIATLIDIIGVRFLLFLVGILGLLSNLIIIKKGDAIILSTNNRT